MHEAVSHECPREVVELAIALHPEQLLERDSSNRVPVEIAATAPVFKVRDGPMEWALLCPSEPASVWKQDASTGLYPFMIAACSCESKAWHTTTIYELLRSCPELIQRGIPEPCLQEEDRKSENGSSSKESTDHGEKNDCQMLQNNSGDEEVRQKRRLNMDEHSNDTIKKCRMYSKVTRTLVLPTTIDKTNKSA